MTIYIIIAGRSSQDEDAGAERDKMGRAIGGLARNIKEPVFFHDYTPTGTGSAAATGAPVILLECSEAFLQEVKKLPGFSMAFEKSSPIPTARSAALWNYFTAAPAARGAPVKKPVRKFQL